MRLFYPNLPGFSIVLSFFVLLLGSCQRSSYVFQPAPSLHATAAGAVVAPVSTEAEMPVARSLAVERVRPKPTANKRGRRLNSITATARLVRSWPLRQAQAQATGKRPLHSTTIQPEPEPERFRSKGIALVLAVLLGGIGAHHFYLGYYGRGAAYVALAALVGFTLLLGVLGLVFGSAAYGGFLLVGIILAFVQQGLVVADIVRIILGDLKPRNGEYYPRFFQVSPDRAPAPAPTTK